MYYLDFLVGSDDPKPKARKGRLRGVYFPATSLDVFLTKNLISLQPGRFLFRM